MSQKRILVVDDEALNLQVICECLDSTSYHIDTALNAEAALEYLQRSDAAFDLIVLDRIMPGMDGLEFLQSIKLNPRFKAIPVIMQTAAGSAEEVAEGIAAGAYYYLVKPYEKSSLQGIVSAALQDRDEHDRLISQNRSFSDSLNLLTEAEFRFAQLQEAFGLAQLVGQICPDPNTATMGLAELLINAIEHGNLGITYDEKKQLREENRWEEEIRRRQQLPELTNRSASLKVYRQDSRLVFRIADCGHGFDWQDYLDFDPERACDPNGRGIAMARMLAFATLEYEEGGRTAVATIDINQTP